MSISSIKDNVFLLQRSTTIIENKAHVFSLRRSKRLEYANDKIFAVNRLLNVDVEVSVDTRRNFHWRYENPGYKEKLISIINGSCELDIEKSKTGWGFWNKSWMKVFDVQPTKEFWARFDVYLLAGSSFRVVNSTEWNKKVGFIINTHASGTSNAKSEAITLNNSMQFPGVNAGFHRILVHFKSGITDGIIQLWCDDEDTPMCERVGNVWNGDYLQNFLTESDNEDAFVSNFIMSTKQLSFLDNCNLDEAHWNQPKLSKNGELGKDDFTVKSSDGNKYIYIPFNGINDPYAFNNIDFFAKDNISIKTLYIVLYRNDYNMSGFKLLKSDDNVRFEEIKVNIRKENNVLIIKDIPRHPYYRLSSGNADCRINKVTIDAITDEPTLCLDTYRKGKYTTTFSEGLVLDGKTNYIEVPVSLAGATEWAAEFTIKTSESRSGTNVVNNPCIFGYDSGGYASRDFHIDIKNGSLHVFSGLDNTKDPIGGTINRSGNDISVSTNVNINDGELHTIRVKYTVDYLRIICDQVFVAEFYPKSTMLNDKLYFGCSMYQEQIFAALELYGAKIWRQGELVAEYSPSIKQVTDNKLYDLSGKNNHAILYGDPIKTVEGQVLSVDTSRHLTCSKMLGISETLARNIAASIRRIQDSNDEYSMLDVASILRTYKQS